MTLEELQLDFNVLIIPLDKNMTLMDGLNYKEDVNDNVRKIAGEEYIALNKEVINSINHFRVLEIDTEEILCQKK